MSDKSVYLDNAATTAVYPEVIELMCEILRDNSGNPSSIYRPGREAKKILSGARQTVASILNCEPREMYFTSGGSEADNMAIKGAVHANMRRGRHIITTKIEHPAVMNTVKSLEKEGFEISYLDPGQDGLIKISDIEAAVRDDTVLAAIMHVNNEIGTIQPIKDAAAAVKAKNKRTLFFTDAVQSVGHIPIDVKQLGVDMLALSGHKFGAPKGIGALYVKSGTVINPIIDGGGQERGKRGGTESPANAAALARALEISIANFSDIPRVTALRDRLLEGILANIPHTILNGDRVNRIYSNINVSIKFIEGESLILLLDMAGICASTGSACSTGSLDPSHVLLAIGLPHEIAHGSLRFSFSHQNTDDDVGYVLEKLPPIVKRLRDMSPIWKG